MPFWGRFDHFQLAVQSVLAQDDPDWRLTILDDKYPDEEPGRWAAAIDDDRVTSVRNDENLKPSRNYTKAVGLARSEFMVIMGCDDVMLPGYVRRVNELVRRFPDADIIQPGVEVIDGEGRVTRPLPDRVKALYRFGGRGARLFRGEQLATSLLRGNWTYFPSLVWRTSRLSGGFRTDLDVVQDLAMLMSITRAGGSLVLDDEVVFQYRRHAVSLSAVTGDDGSKFAQEATVFDEEAVACEALGWRRAARAARAHVSSRLNALSELPGAVLHGSAAGRRNLVRHILG